jgi:membrane fusion protein, heavy metal efflux system
MRWRIHAAALAIAVIVAGCGSEPKDTKRGAGSSEPKSPAPAAEGAMCKEHGVLEAICTKCNPKLIPVFMAKGDWCKEHEFPESVCPICHPERGGKPAVDVSGDGAPADGTKVRFKTKETAELAGILTEKAALRSHEGGVLTTVRLAYDATKLAEINARSPGVVRALKVDVGAKVKQGATLAVIDSPEVGAERSKLAAARSRVDVAEEHLRRDTQLQAEGIVARKDILAAQQELAAAKAEYGALSASLAIMGPGAGGAGSYALTTPIAGVVTQRNVTIGRLVSGDAMLFQVVDTSTMWADLDVPENELGAVAPEQPVIITVDGIGGREFRGTISFVAPAVDAHTRTSMARVPLENPDGVLRAGMFGQARIVTKKARVSVMVPRSAVQRAKTVQVVFVRIANDHYETRRVETGATEGPLIELLKGVRPGEDVVTQGSFLLKTETLKESIGAGCCEVD